MVIYFCWELGQLQSWRLPWCASACRRQQSMALGFVNSFGIFGTSLFQLAVGA